MDEFRNELEVCISSKRRLTIYLFYCSLEGEKELLLLRRTAQSHRFPGFEEVIGGRVGEGEAPRSAGLRELQEEIGLNEAEIAEHVGVDEEVLRHFRDYVYGDNHVNHVYYVLFQRKPKVDLSKNPDHEHDTHRWTPFHEINQLAYKHLEILHELTDTLHWRD